MLFYIKFLELKKVALTKNIKKKKTYLKWYQSFSLYIHMFLYGLILSMLIYTQSGFKHYLNIHGSFYFYVSIQTIGIVLGSFLVIILIKYLWINIYYFLIYINIFIFYMLIAYLNHLTTSKELQKSLFALFEFFIGLSIGQILTVTLILFNINKKIVISKDKKFKRMIFINGIYYLGASFLPLFFSNIIIKITTDDNFKIIWYFFLVSSIFIICGSLLCFLYPSQKIKVSREIKHLMKKFNHKNDSTKSRFKYHMFYVLISFMFLYMLSVIIIEYNFIPYISLHTSNNKGHKIEYIRSYGLLVLVQGLVNIFASIVFKIKKLLSHLVFHITFLICILIIFELLKIKFIYEYYLFAVLIGFGLGTIWILLYLMIVFFVGKKYSIIFAYMINIGNAIFIFLGQILSGIFSNDQKIGHNFYEINLLEVIPIIAFIYIIIGIYYYKKKYKLTNI